MENILTLSRLEVQLELRHANDSEGKERLDYLKNLRRMTAKELEVEYQDYLAFIWDVDSVIVN